MTSYMDKTGRRGLYSFNEKICQDSLYLFFENGFDTDTLDVRVGDCTRNLLLDTNSILGLADFQSFGELKNTSEFSISINGSKNHRVEILDQKMNKWAISIRRDTVWITVLNNAPFYD